jgi:hypothetical protein
MSAGRKIGEGGRKKQIPPRCARQDDNGSLKAVKWKLRSRPYNYEPGGRDCDLLPSQIGLFSANLTRHSVSNGIMLKLLKTNNRCPAHSTLEEAFAAPIFQPKSTAAPVLVILRSTHRAAALEQTTTKSFLTYRGANTRVGGCKRACKAQRSTNRTRETVAQFSRFESATGRLTVVGLRVVVGVTAPVWGLRAS